MQLNNIHVLLLNNYLVRSFLSNEAHVSKYLVYSRSISLFLKCMLRYRIKVLSKDTINEFSLAKKTLNYIFIQRKNTSNSSKEPR